MKVLLSNWNSGNIVFTVLSLDTDAKFTPSGANAH